jgi:hypothetical protein
MTDEDAVCRGLLARPTRRIALIALVPVMTLVIGSIWHTSGTRLCRTISLRMSAVATSDQFHRKSIRILIEPSVTVSPCPTGPLGTQRARRITAPARAR